MDPDWFNQWKNLDDHLDGIGLPNGQNPEPLEYDLRKISKFMRETGKEFIDLTEEEKEKFKKPPTK